MYKRIRLLLMITALIVLVGCGASPKSKPTDIESSGPGEKVLNMALLWLDGNIEPTENWNGWTLTRCGIGENLIKFDENLNLKPVIAESYEQKDETTFIFNIREGVTFHNGNIVDAKACKESIERALEISNRDEIKFPVESIEADGQKLTIKTTRPYATLLNNLADPVYIIVDASVADDENFKFKPIATGAFKVVEFDANEGLKLEKHDKHWSGDIGVDIVNAKYIKDGSTRTMALQSGEIDLATQIGTMDLTLFENNEDFVVQKGPNLRIFLFRLNFDKPYMESLEFRQALCYGMDKETYTTQIVKAISAKGPFNESLSFGYKGDDFYSYNPKKANELLDKAGFTDTDGDGIRESDGENIILKCVIKSSSKDAINIATAMQVQYKEIGLGLEIVQVENKKSIIKSGDFDLTWDRWTSAPAGDPQYFLEASFKTNGIGNLGKYSNPEFDNLCNTLDSTIDKGTRDKLGIEGSEFLMKDVASIFMFYQEGNIITSKKVHDVYRYISEIYYIDERVTID